ncbi:MAG: response regulator [Dehalococcoidales bacterium]|nr:response regulator [Dehalococcoidales bacterium]
MEILIANKDSDLTMDLSLTFNRLTPDWKVTIVDSGIECMEKLKQGNCRDAIILGMQLSDTSGLDLLAQIRDDSDIPVIFISNDKNTDLLVQVFDAGANDFIVKPFNDELFIASLKAVIRRRIWDIPIKGFNLMHKYKQGIGCQSSLGKSDN